MSRILVAFYNGIKSERNPNAIPIFYESFLNGLCKAGNEVKTYAHNYFGNIEWGSIEKNPEVKKEVMDFDPQVCILFNNAFFDISDIVDCPIIVYEVDSPDVYANPEALATKKDRYLYFIAQEKSRDRIKQLFGPEDDYIRTVPFFSEIQANNDYCLEKVNISFIGSFFRLAKDNAFLRFMRVEPTYEILNDCLKYYKWMSNNPLEDENVFWNSEKNFFTERCRKLFFPFDVVHDLSNEKRIQVLSVIEPLGLKIYGSKEWAFEYYNNINLNMAYDPTEIYSLKNNQDVYNSSKIGISIAHLQAIDGFPWRIMDIMASNACLVTDYHSGFDRAFPKLKGVIPIYENAGEAYVQCKKLLQDEPLRQNIVLQCQEVIEEKYRFRHCLRTIEEYLGMNLHEKNNKNEK